VWRGLTQHDFDTFLGAGLSTSTAESWSLSMRLVRLEFQKLDSSRSDWFERVIECDSMVWRPPGSSRGSLKIDSIAGLTRSTGVLVLATNKSKLHHWGVANNVRGIESAVWGLMQRCAGKRAHLHD